MNSRRLAFLALIERLTLRLNLETPVHHDASDPPYLLGRDDMIEQLKGATRFDWRPEGLICEIALPT
jgi:hypothetical protein